MNHGLQPKHVSSAKGGEFASACPMCGGDDRFRIWPEQNEGTGSYWCRQCGKHGDRIQFVIETKNVKYPEACQITGDVPAERKNNGKPVYKSTPTLPGAVVPKSTSPYKPKEKDPANDPIDADKWAEHAEKLVSWAQKKLSGSAGEQVLSDKGIDTETAEKYRIGWLPEDIYRQRDSWGLPEVMSEKTGKPKRLWFPTGLVIPHIITMPDGIRRVDRIRIRRPDGEPRYYIIPGSCSRQLITGTPGRIMMIVESELDALLLDQIIGNSMGIVSVGTSHAKPDKWAQQVLRDAVCILVSLDNDPAGQSAFGWWHENYQYAINHPVPVGKDPSDAHHQKCDLHAWIISGLPQGLRNLKPQASRPPHSHNANTRKSELRDFSQPDHPTHNVDPSVKTSVTMSVSVPDSISELHSLIKKNRAITIAISSTSLTLSAPAEWRKRHEQDFSRISRLIYFDSDVFEFLHSHGSKNINANNLMEAK